MAMGASVVIRYASFVILSLTISTNSIVSGDVSYRGHWPSSAFAVIEYQPLLGPRLRRQAVGNTNNSSSTTTITNSSPGPISTTVSSESQNTNDTTTVGNSTPTTTVSSTAVPVTTSTAASSTRPPTTASQTGTTSEPTIYEDNYQYYKSVVSPNAVDSVWSNIDSGQKHKTLSESHRTAVTLDLSFRFQFYGHPINNLTVATGGFMYMSPFLHQWLTATQYIAPLMANFDTTLGNGSDVLYKDFGDKFVVQWKNVLLKDQSASGQFNFQVQLHKNGTIIFAYKLLPIPVNQISKDNHPVKVGLSDAFYIDNYIAEYNIKRRTIYEYHRVAIPQNRIMAGTVVVLNPLPTCNNFTNCGDCVRHPKEFFDCKWCPAVQRCSSGIDWYRQEWLNKDCKNKALNTPESCLLTTTMSTASSEVTTTVRTSAMSSASPSTKTRSSTSAIGSSSPSSSSVSSAPPPGGSTDPNASARGGKDNICGDLNSASCPSKQSMPVGGIVAIVIVIVVVLGSTGIWFFYAYTHPTSSSGMWLMEHRPSQMKDKIAKIKFWKTSTPAGTKYQVESEA